MATPNAKTKKIAPTRIKESLYVPTIQGSGRGAQDHQHTPEYLIEVFGRDKEIQLVVVQNLIDLYLRKLHNEQWLNDVDKIIPKLPADSFLCGLYQRMVRQTRREQWQIKRRTQFLGQFYDLSHGTNFFSPKPVAITGHIDTIAIKENAHIEVVVARDVELRPSGRTFKGRCPFHRDKTPSFFVYPEEGRWWCFGACNEGGDAIDFVQRIRNCNFREAVGELQRL
ncbi:MAG: hypothetical protein HYR90_00920 [Candidatus Andersenbacteria bacterium]|nr:hypothetical protein [Candidatus Andersenbacteria bacterium]MBI3251189.1 hypothetical protein [Candidatus Andersenbacteria bacterium]